mmetsp:Transcript_39950/g.103383  ORF Transcript_39950/g.103383 Transcript_39950/m.103383 type:complete len:110 (-) Transcript_39950:26-355(-)
MEEVLQDTDDTSLSLVLLLQTANPFGSCGRRVTRGGPDSIDLGLFFLSLVGLASRVLRMNSTTIGRRALLVCLHLVTIIEPAMDMPTLAQSPTQHCVRLPQVKHEGVML